MNILDKFSYRIKIQYKLLLTFLGIAIFPLIILGIAQDVLFTREAPGQFAFIMVFIIVLIMSIVLAFLAARHFDKAIQTLSIGADMLSKGKLDWRVELKTHDEMEDLAIAFNTMASQLKSSYDGLENRVKEMTTELQGEKNKFESILMSLGEGIIVADEKDRIFIINTMAEKILGINHRDYIGKTYFGCHKNVDDIINLVDLSKTRHIERVVTVDKKTIHINIATIKSDNKMLGVAMIMQDITEEKELEKQKQDFISMITHDIKSPLTSILGFSSLLLNQHKDTMDQRMKDAIETINSSANKILFLAEDYLTSSKLESGYFNIEIKPIKIEKILDDLIPTFRPQIEEQKMTLNYSFEKDMTEILGDPVQIDRVFSNIINNAIKFTPQGGKINIHAEQVIDNDIKYIEVTVQDSGIGIPSNEINTMFEKYSRLKNSRNTKGTGLGLYIAKIIIESHHGYIWVESKEGEGSIFHVKLRGK